MKRRLIHWLLRRLGYDPPHMLYPELYAISDGIGVYGVTTDQKRAYRMFERGKGEALVRYVPAERVVVK